MRITGKWRIAPGFFLLLMSPWLQAAIQQADVALFGMDVWRIQSDFHMYTVMAGDREYRDRLEESIERGEDTLATLRDSAEGEDDSELLSKLNQAWPRFRELAMSDRSGRDGYADAYTVRDFEAEGDRLIEALEAYEGADEEKYADVLALGKDLQRLAAEYLKLAADPAGGMAAGSGQRISFSEAVPRFDKQLTALQEKYSDDQTIKRTLRQVSLRWDFIRDSLVNFSENAVPFLIHRYSHQMTDELEVATSLATSGGAQQPMQGGMPTPQGPPEG